MKIKNIFLALLATAALTSCVQDLLDTNKNPNEAQIAQPDYLLTNAIKSSVDTYWGTTNNLDGTLLFAQHVAKIQYTEIDRVYCIEHHFRESVEEFLFSGIEGFG